MLRFAGNVLELRNDVVNCVWPCRKVRSLHLRSTTTALQALAGPLVVTAIPTIEHLGRRQCALHVAELFLRIGLRADFKSSANIRPSCGLSDQVEACAQVAVFLHRA